MLRLLIGNKNKPKRKGLINLHRRLLGILSKSLSKKMALTALVLVGLSCFAFGVLLESTLQENRIAKYYITIRYLENANMKLERELRMMEEIFEYSEKYRIDAGLAELIYRVALEEKVEPELFFNLIEVESQFKQFAVSQAGALGYTQLMFKTAKALYPELKNKAELFIPELNLRLGARELKRLLTMWQGNIELALLCYNRGVTRVVQVSDQGGNPDNGYPSRVTQ